MRVSFALCLPRDEASVPVVRHLCRSSLQKLGVEDDCVSDLEVALSEACTNVLKHAEDAEGEYEVQFEVTDSECEIRVIDIGGRDFEHASIGLEEAHPGAEGGRGIHLMRALVDDLKFAIAPEHGLVLYLNKHLGLREGSVLQKLGSYTRN